MTCREHEILFESERKIRAARDVLEKVASPTREQLEELDTIRKYSDTASVKLREHIAGCPVCRPKSGE
jgi:hypothetical protein